MPQQKKIADRLREAIRLRGYSIRTEKAYLYWYERFIRFLGLKRLEVMYSGAYPSIERLFSFLWVCGIGDREAVAPAQGA